MKKLLAIVVAGTILFDSWPASAFSPAVPGNRPSVAAPFEEQALALNSRWSRSLEPAPSLFHDTQPPDLPRKGLGRKAAEIIIIGGAGVVPLVIVLVVAAVLLLPFMVLSVILVSGHRIFQRIRNRVPATSPPLSSVGSSPDISVVIPAYNEKDTVEATLRRVAQVPGLLEMIVVDNMSNDGTGAILDDLQSIWTRDFAAGPKLIVLHQSEKAGDAPGKGSAVRAGIRLATGKAVIIQDADDEYSPEEIPLVAAPILAGRAQVVYGSRNLRWSNRKGKTFLGGVLVTLATNLVLATSNPFSRNVLLTDEPTCYKCFDRGLIQSIRIQEDGFAWEPEVTLAVARLGHAIHQVPISYTPRAPEEGKKLKPLQDGWKALQALGRYRRTPKSSFRSGRRNPRPVSLEHPLARLFAAADPVEEVTRILAEMALVGRLDLLHELFLRDTYPRPPDGRWGTLQRMDVLLRALSVCLRPREEFPKADSEQNRTANFLSHLLDESGRSLDPSLVQMTHSVLEVFNYRPADPTQETTVATVFSMYGEQVRMLPPSVHPHGEDFVRVKIRQLQDLYAVNPRIRWRLMGVQDGDDRKEGDLHRSVASGDAMEAILRAEYPELLESGQVRVIRLSADQKKLIGGRKGSGIVLGMAEAIREDAPGGPADVVIYTDADNSTNIGLEGREFNVVSRDPYAVAVASRRDPTLVEGRGLLARVSSFIYLKTVHTLRPRLKGLDDTQAGFKGFSRALLERINPARIVYGKAQFDPDFPYNFSFDTALLDDAAQAGGHLVRVAIPWVDSAPMSTIDLWNDTKAMFRGLWYQRLRERRLRDRARHPIMSPAQRELEHRREGDYWWFIGRRHLLAALARRFAPPGTDSLAYFDMGAGSGRVAESVATALRASSLYRDVFVVDLEYDPADIPSAEDRRGHAWMAGDGQALGLLSQSFGVVTAFDVLEHIPDDLRAESEIFRVLEPGGRVLAAVPAFQRNWSSHDRVLGHYRRYEKGELADRMRRAGFEILYDGYTLRLLYPLFLLKLWGGRWRRPAEDEETTDLPTLPAFVNSLFVRIMRLETFLMTRGLLALPWKGLSSVVVAQRPLQKAA